MLFAEAQARSGNVCVAGQALRTLLDLNERSWLDPA